MLNAHCWRCSRRVFWTVGQRTACRQMLRNVDFALSDWMASRCQWRSSRKYKTEAPNTVFKVSISQGLLRRLWLFVSLALTQSNRLDWESIEKSWARRHIAVSCCAYRCQSWQTAKEICQHSSFRLEVSCGPYIASATCLDRLKLTHLYEGTVLWMCTLKGFLLYSTLNFHCTPWPAVFQVMWISITRTMACLRGEHLEFRSSEGQSKNLWEILVIILEGKSGS